MISPAPRIEQLPIAVLTTDPEVQRSVDKARVDKIVKDYHPEALGTIIVSRRGNGTHHIIDGQHRVQATIAAGYGNRAITCQVYDGLSRADEAAMFRRLNNTRQVSPIDKFRVRVIEGDAAAVLLNGMLNRHGWTVRTSKSGGSFAAVGALESVYRGKLNGPGSTELVCELLIRAVTESWGHNADGVRAEIVSGLGAVLLRFNSRVDVPKLILELSKHEGGPRGLVGRAKNLHTYRGGKLSDALAEIVVELLNKQRRNNRLPEWRSAA